MVLLKMNLYFINNFCNVDLFWAYLYNIEIINQFKTELYVKK